MPYTEPFIYLRAHGFMGPVSTPYEEWSVGFKLPCVSGSVPTSSLNAFLDTVSGPISVFHAHTDVKAGVASGLKELQAAVVGVDGKYTGGGAQKTTIRPYPSPIYGTGTGIHPFTAACVLSLRTTLQRGRASNGRAYWPALALQINGSTGVIDPTPATNIATAAATMLNAINQAADVHFTDVLGVWVMSNLGEGTSAPVTSVRVGNKLDTQESRERSIVEAYISKPVTPTPFIAAQLSEDLEVGAVRRIRRP